MFAISSFLLLAVLAVPLYLLSVFFNKKPIPKNLKRIPSTAGIPFLGNMLETKGRLYRYLFETGKKLGGIFIFKMGAREIVILNNSDVLHKTLKEQANVFSGRWQNVLVKHIIHDSGILFKDKEWWATQRSFLLRVLRDFGFGKQRSNEIVSQECGILLKELEQNSGKVVSCRFLFPIYMVNIISKLCMSIRFRRDDKDFVTLTRIIESVAQNSNTSIQLILMYPILERFSILAKFLICLTGRDKEMSVVHDYMKKIIEEHRSRFNPNNEGEDVIDMYLLEQHKLEQSHVKNHTFTEWQIIRVVFELFIAGYETTSTTMSWAMILLARSPETQQAMFHEITTVIGSERAPSMNDKKNLPYTQAVMDEVFRYSSVVPLSLPHRVLEDTQVNGFYIPKNSIVFPNLFSIHRDPAMWKRPNDFYPEHFLTQDADGDWKYEPREDLAPFSIGKRQCLGESLARMEFFVFLTSIVQRFKMQLPADTNNEVFTKMTFGTDGTIRAPIGSDVIYTLRE